jgi:hypothetical protein
VSGNELFPYRDYDKEPLEIFEDPSFTVYDPWAAQELAVFKSRQDAELFAKALVKKWRKSR